ncbi:MAG: hypothetical protein HY545_02490 [Candidatus Doudnabacteria bacterium]|nr:hypothetical protein [Candidatus Doudnabacteria bacterium]
MTEGRESENILGAMEELKGRVEKFIREIQTVDWHEEHITRWKELLRSVASLSEEYKQKHFDADYYYDRLSKLLEQLEVLAIVGDSGAVDVRRQRMKKEKAFKKSPRSTG